MKRGILLGMLLLPCLLRANMASPWVSGSHFASALSTRYLDIRSERLRVEPEPGWHGAVITATYTIHGAQQGLLPLLFVALQEDSVLGLEIDGQPVNWMRYGSMDPPPDIRAFIRYFEEMDMEWADYTQGIQPENCIYFEPVLDSGAHTVQVQYHARAWEEHNPPLLRRSIRYALSPARLWKTFGGLRLEIRLPQAGDALTHNLPVPPQDVGDSLLVWQFDHLPVQTLILEYQPPISGFTHFLIQYEIKLLFLILLAMFALHFYFLRRRKVRMLPTHPLRYFLLTGFLGFLLPVALYLSLQSLIQHGMADAYTYRGAGYTLIFLLFLYPVYGLIWLVTTGVLLFVRGK